jgi:hypothetical protein
MEKWEQQICTFRARGKNPWKNHGKSLAVPGIPRWFFLWLEQSLSTQN